MRSNIIRSLMPVFIILLITMLACNISSGAGTPAAPTSEQVSLIPVAGDLATPTPAQILPTATVAIAHSQTPTDPRGGKVVYDVESAGTAPEQRAPYGDSYDMNRLERPFSQEMSYVSDLDIASFTVAKDNDWWYVSVELIGKDPNNIQGIHYGVELDLNRDGFGDYLIWARPPYTDQWDTVPVQIYQDQNHNTGGLSGAKSDAPFSADGYETLIFDGSLGGSDPDMAWVRINAGVQATVQFAFKKSWSGSVFMLGVIADAGWKDPGKLDYVDRIPIAEAGSPVKDNMYYPLKSLFLVDNTCRDAFGFEPTHYEPQICPVEPTPTKGPREPQPGGGPTSVSGCPPHPACLPGSEWDSDSCECVTTIY
ncbi:MAG TPA: hypothetical protein VFQ13_22785 [Anaerolineales bacterium]|nr:hypothetical protein [Anaerolineales bacterium]